MSIVDTNVNTVVAYESGKTKPFEGQRLASFSWKTSSDKDSLWFGIKRASKAVSLPKIPDSQIQANLAVLMPHVRKMLESTQDKIIREMLESSDNLLHVSNESVSIAACIEFLEDSNESGRLTKEIVGTWFDAQIADNLMLALASKIAPTNDGDLSDSQAKQVESLVREFKLKVSALAGGKTTYSPKLAESVKKCILLASPEDALRERFLVRLDKMMKESEEVSLLEAL